MKYRAYFSCAILALAVIFAGCRGSTTGAPSTTAPAADAVIDPANMSGVLVYNVTIENLTTGQPFSPGVIATHTHKANVFRVGEPASEGIRLIAENGDPSVAVADLSANQYVSEALATGVPVHRIGGPGPNTLTVQIKARGNAKRISLALMLICTNDGFVGLDDVKLPRGFKPDTYFAMAYDAGTELNDELYTSIVDACGAIGPVSVPADGSNDRTPTSDPIADHPGIAGTADLNAGLHGWTDPVAKVTIQRVKE